MKNSRAWIYVLLALIAGLAFGGLVFTWFNPFPGGPAAAPNPPVTQK